MQVYAIKVTLLDTNPPVWRRFLVERDIPLRELHGVLQKVMGWWNAHLHQFVFNGQKRSEKTKLGDVMSRPGASLLYEYDFGDGWRHELVLEEVLIGDESFQQICVAGIRNCPPEDCGGPHGFAELLEVLQDSKHPEHDSMREWVGEGYAPEHFSVDEINRKLRRKRRSSVGRPNRVNAAGDR
jgi:hypothetical protein